MAKKVQTHATCRETNRLPKKNVAIGIDLRDGTVQCFSLYKDTCANLKPDFRIDLQSKEINFPKSGFRFTQVIKIFFLYHPIIYNSIIYRVDRG